MLDEPREMTWPEGVRVSTVSKANGDVDGSMNTLGRFPVTAVQLKQRMDVRVFTP